MTRVLLILCVVTLLLCCADANGAQLLQQDDIPTISLDIPEPSTAQNETLGLQSWVVEITYIVVISLYALNYFRGRRTNQKIAHAWATSAQTTFSTNFTRFGEQDTFVITKESQHLYTLSCSGRANCHGAQVSLELNKRQDLLSLIMGYLLTPHTDTLVYDIAMEESVPPFVFAVVNKREKQITKDYPDIAKFAHVVNFPALPNYLVYTDTPEVQELLLTSEIIHSIKTYEQYVKIIYFSDQSAITPKYPKILRFVYKLPSVTEMGKLSTLTRMAFFYIDLIAKIKLSKNAVVKNEKARTVIAEQSAKQQYQERQEAIQKKKIEQKRRDEEKFEKLSPEEKRKWEEREYKKQLKEKKSKFKVKYG